MAHLVATRTQSLRDRIVVAPRGLISGTVLIAALTLGMLTGKSTPAYTLGVSALALMVVGTAVTIAHPRIIYGTLAVTMGAAPMMVAPGVPLPFILVLAAAMWCAVLTHPIANGRIHGLEIAVAVLILTSTIGMIMTAYGGKAHVVEYVKWLLATSVVFAISRLSHADARLFGRLFVLGTTGATLFALGMRQFDSSGSFMNKLTIIGYGNTGTIGTHLRFYESPGGDVVRLTGTYVDPNIAGIFIFVGLSLAIALFRGVPRLVLTVVLGVGLIVTLSRAAIFSLVVAVLFLLVFGRMRAALRSWIVIGFVVVGSVALTLPSISERILTSFGSEDKGSTDRAEAFSRFPHYMQGKWLFGHGFGAPEFTDEVIGWNTNYVANSPLLTVYRAGVAAGLAFVVVLIVGVVTAYRNARGSPWESGVVGAAFVGFSTVALQLDFPVVTHAPVTMVFSVLIAMVIVNPINETTDPKREPSVNALILEPPRRNIHGRTC